MILDPVSIAFFILCVILSAFFSSSEVALLSITRAKVRTLLNNKKPGAEALSQLKESPNTLLTTILIGNTIVNISAASIATGIAIQMFGDVGIGIATGFVVIVLLVFGEIGPKVSAARATEGFALAVARPLLYLSYIFSPLIWIVDRVSRSLRPHHEGAETSVTEDEIKEWIDVGTEEGTIEEEEQDMLYSVLEFGDTAAHEIMTPRVDVTVMEDTTTFPEAVRIFNETGFSRIPVYHGKTDNITGILNVKDVFSALVSSRKETIADIMYDPFFVPETKKIDDLLKELRTRRLQIAVVMDEYGSFAGIVTVEDILEELVGDIQDETDTEEPKIQKISEGLYIIDAQLWVKDLNEHLGIALPVGESYDTIGGLFIERAGHIPQHPGEKVEIQECRATLVVMQMHGRRIIKVKVILHPPENEGAGV